ncbi:MAG TPA: 30S ribosomal protein S9 [Thermomicrobiales bacterium]|nr:30S ribosomal protein S9 [Thermomicrobiales bacterium]
MSEQTQQAPSGQYYYGVGRRKTSVARVRLYPGSGQIIVNGKPGREYFGGRTVHQQAILAPMQMTGTTQKFDVVVTVVGGGVSGQAGAVRHGISRALLRFDDEFRPVLKSAKMLTRDAREKERKKVGLKRARKAPQYTKR